MEYKIIKTNRTTFALEIMPNGTLLVRAPRFASQKMIDSVVESKNKWIRRKMREIELLPKPMPVFRKDVPALKKKTEEIVSPLVKKWCEIMELTCDGVHITMAQKRFGSCSFDDHLCFSCFLALYPIELVEYVVVHELCHIIEHSHSSYFYEMLECYLPDWKERELALKHRPLPRVEDDK